MKFTKRNLKIIFRLGEGSFTGKPEDNSIELSGLRIDAEIKVMPNSMVASAQITVFGLKAETMNALTLIKGVMQANMLKPNTVSLYTDDDDGKETLVFTGMIFHAMADYNTMPVIPMSIYAMSSYELNVAESPAISFSGSVSVVEIVQAVVNLYNASHPVKANQYTVENNGVDGVLTDVALTGSFSEMLNAIARQADIVIQTEGRVVVISKKDKARQIEATTISAENDMIGYPTLIPNGCIVRVLYNPYYRWMAPVTVKSHQILFQKGLGKEQGASEAKFRIVTMLHRLQSETPGGVWQTEMRLIYLTEE